MRVYKLSMHDQNPPLRDVQGCNDYEELLTGAHNWRVWRTPMVENKTVEQTGSDKLHDFTAIQLGDEFPLVSDRARLSMQEVCGIHGRWLPVRCPEKDYTLLNSRNIIDALDEDNCVMTRHSDSARIRSISTYSFRPQVIEHEWIFRTSSLPTTLFYTDRFADLYKQQKWTGLWLDPVWDSELEPFPDRPTRKDIVARPDVYGPSGIVRGLEHAWPSDWQDQSTSRPN